jgi:hypothetical protein
MTDSNPTPNILSLDSSVPYYHDLKEIQQKVYQQNPMFPLQSHSDFLVSPLSLLIYVCAW